MMIADWNITWTKKRTTFTLVRLLAVAEIILIAGIAVISICTSGKKREKRSSGSILVQREKRGGNDHVSPRTASPSNKYSFSEESQRIGLAEFLGHVKAT